MSKHNKIKNTGILFDILVEVITNSIMSNNLSEENKAKELLKKYFNETELSKEYNLFRTIYDTKLNENKFDNFLQKIFELRKKINETKLYNEKYNLIKDLNEQFNTTELFKKRFNNYKLNASIYNIFEYVINKKIDPEIVVQSKNSIKEHVTNKITTNKLDVIYEFKKLDEKTRLLSYKLLIEKFNKKYENFNEEQKKVLNLYINTISNSPSLKNNINNEILSFKTYIIENISNKNIDKRTQIKLIELSKRLDEIFKGDIATDENILNLLRIQELKPELQKILK